MSCFKIGALLALLDLMVLSMAGPGGDTNLPQLSLVEDGNSFPTWTLKSKDGNLVLRLMYQKLCLVNASEWFTAALITGVSFSPIDEPTHAKLSMTLPRAHVMSDSASFSEYRKHHRIPSNITQPSAAQDRLYGFQAAGGQPDPQFTPNPPLFKSGPCCKVAMRIPLRRFAPVWDMQHQWQGSVRPLKAELQRTDSSKHAAVAVAWLWLESQIKSACSKKPPL